jgi:predicted phosphodiesterase
MIYAIISDIHGNLESLRAVLDDIEGCNVDKIFCLGDIVGYCSNPEECVNLVREKCDTVMMGNHDYAVQDITLGEKFNHHAKLALNWTIANLSNSAKEYLYDLPYIINEENICFVHASPKEPDTWRYVTNMEEALSSFDHFEGQVCFIGHTHFPIVVTNQGELIEKIELKLQKNVRYLINVGSIGQPRDGNNRSCYGIFDSKTRQFQFRRVRYNIALTQKKMRTVNLPDYLIERLSAGR